MTPIAARRPEVFISFASQELPIAEELTKHLDDAGIPTFFAPRDLVGGMNFAVEIVRAIGASDVVAVLLSPSAVSSPHVRREVSLAIDERRALLPLALPGTQYPSGFTAEWTYWLSAVQVMDYRGPQSTVERVRHLLVHHHSHPTAELDGDSQDVVAPSETKVRRPIVLGRDSPSALLRAERTVVPLCGRAEELARLEQWCYRADDFDARIVTGGAGQGKTRLAFELASRVRDTGWNSEFVLAGETGASVLDRVADRPHLLVVDYAETRADQVIDLLSAALRQGIGERVRLLLLARTASDWWGQLKSKRVEVGEVLDGVAVQAIMPLVADRAAVNQLYESAYERFATQLGVTSGSLPTIAPYKTYATVLDVLEDALTAVLGGAAGTGRLLSHERRYVAAAARADGITDVDVVDLDRIAAAVSLYGAVDENEAAALVMDCNPDLPAPTRRRLGRLFRRLYPGSSLYVEGLRPDALAENLIGEVLVEHGSLPGLNAAEWAASHTEAQRRRSLTLLARAGARHEAVRHELDQIVRHAGVGDLALAIEIATQIEEPQHLTALLAAVVEDRPDRDAMALLEGVPDETVVMAELAARLSRKAMSGLGPPATMDLTDVRISMACSNRFSDAGWIEDASRSAALAIEQLSTLGTNDPTTRELLGRAWANRSNRLWEMGHLQDSLLPARRAVQELVAAQAGNPELAAARNNLGFRLSEVGSAAEALQELLSAEELCRDPGPADTQSAARTLGAALNNLACVQLAVGDAAMAKQYGTAAVTLRRSQAITSRDRFLPNIARSLANAACAAAAHGDADLAIRLITEARSLHAQVGHRAPIFRFEEAEGATLHAVILLAQGRHQDAARAVDEGISFVGPIAAGLDQLAVRLTHTLDCLSDMATDGDAEAAQLMLGPISGRPLHLPQLLEYRDL